MTGFAICFYEMRKNSNFLAAHQRLKKTAFYKYSREMWLQKLESVSSSVQVHHICQDDLLCAIEEALFFPNGTRCKCTIQNWNIFLRGIGRRNRTKSVVSFNRQPLWIDSLRPEIPGREITKFASNLPSNSVVHSHRKPSPDLS